MTIKELVEQSHQTAVRKDWWKTPRPFLELMALVHSEISEAVEDYRNGKPICALDYDTDGKPIGIPSELADVFIRIADLCGAHSINLEEAIEAKLRYNMTRPARHGDKLA